MRWRARTAGKAHTANALFDPLKERRDAVQYILHPLNNMLDLAQPLAQADRLRALDACVGRATVQAPPAGRRALLLRLPASASASSSSPSS